MKAALKAKNDPSHWTEHIPIILLGIRSTVKDDLKCSPAELVYGTTLRLPAQFVAPQQTTVDPSDYVSRLRNHMSQFTPTPPRSQHTTTHVPTDLHTCSYVFVRVDRVRKPLQQPYDGPYKVLRRNVRHYTLEINGKKEQVSVDRLKVAHVESSSAPDDVVVPRDTTRSPLESPPATSTASDTPAAKSDPPVRQTRSGRH
ncbi:uncharacterized protein, partial [Diadema antillarum]|uniref:uncharacterized protein n=1 Tax=Diadema antillarum TaxID=105358 RepID=UPI003A872E6E